jgi:hypothetical protein
MPTIDSSKLPHALTSFHWTHGGIKVLLIGSFTQWKDTIEMVQETAGFSCILNLPIGIHSYKFIVDGEWRYSPDQETITDSNGNVNNCIAVTSSIPYGCSISFPCFSSLLFSFLQGLKLIRYTDKAKHSIPVAWSPSQARKSTPPPLGKQLTRNQLLIPGVQEVTRSPARSSVSESTPTLKKETSANLLQTYAAGGEDLARGSHKLLLVMVGLPARGKSFISRKLCRYMNWLGFKCRVFNLGSYRRDRLGGFLSHDWYRPDNPEVSFSFFICIRSAEGLFCMFFLF